MAKFHTGESNTSIENIQYVQFSNYKIHFNHNCFLSICVDFYYELSLYTNLRPPKHITK